MKPHSKWAQIVGAGGTGGFKSSIGGKGKHFGATTRRQAKGNMGGANGQGKKLGHTKKLTGKQYKGLKLAQGFTKRKDK